TAEKIHDGNLLDDPTLAAGTLPGFYVDAVAVAERGAWPLGLPDFYAADAEHLAEYARMAATAEGFAEYLDRHVYERSAAYQTHVRAGLVPASQAFCPSLRDRLDEPGDNA